MIKISEVNKKIDAVFNHTVELRRTIHANPELGGEEVETAALVKKELDEMGIPYHSEINGHGIYAVIEGQNPDVSIGIRADMDALPMEELTDVPFKSCKPGIMHACGHDIHTSVLLGTARVLSEMKDQLKTSVTLIFEPAEESDGGAEALIEAGCLDKPKAESVIGLHISPSYNAGSVIISPGAMNAATCEFVVRVIGKSCHGAHPDQGIDPLLPACTMITSLQTVITRRIHPADAALITVGKFNSGTGSNMIPDETTFSGTIRVLDMSLRDYIKKELLQLFKGTAAAFGADCDVTFHDGYPTLVNDDGVLNQAVSVYREVLGEGNVIISPRPSLGADDFAYFCHKAPSLYFDIGSKRPEEAPGPLHSSTLNPDEKCIRTGIQAEVFGALKLMGEEIIGG